MVRWIYKQGRGDENMNLGNHQEAGNHALNLKQMGILFKTLQDNGNTLMCEGSKRRGGWDLSCYIGRGKGSAGTKCTLYTTKKSDERSSKTGKLRQLSNSLYSIYVLLFYRCNMKDYIADCWCMGSETCMQYTTKGFNGEGVGTLHSQSTTLKREECLVIRLMYSGLLRGS
ncbi:hypothetical protein L1987_14051 [Smallanthus sonchifolius]|uniref:Uncharacterized protein n=1 Tax=Smallanthus sonchifolius TaxID=185202 RepID=A0ACB9JI42_9ASTR|nr:hypothetical protein L1987_14051 [Smallanthus sonchifolius]